jgi:transposase-like protein
MSILEGVPSDAKIRSLIRRATFGVRPHCPRCGSGHVRRSEDRWRCPKCRRPFSLTSVSWLSGMKIAPRDLWLLLACWQKRVAFGTAADVTGLSRVTVRRWFRRFRWNFSYESPILEEFVEADESFHGRRRRGAQRIVLGAVERGAWRPVVRASRKRDQESTDRFLLAHVREGATVATDEAGCYLGIDAFFGYRHVTCNHSKFVFGETNRIEAVWSALKRFIRRTYDHVQAEWLPDILREFEARANAPELFLSPLTFLENSLVAVPSR